MAGKKYTRDYRLIDSVDECGRIRTDTEYIGAYYRFAAGYETALAAQKRMGLFSRLAALCFLLSLLPRSTASFTLYVTLPYLFTALPLALLLTTLYRLRCLGERLDHRAADQSNDHIPGRCFASFLLPALAIVGEAVALLLGGAFLVGDALFLLGALGCLVCALLCFRERKLLRAIPE